MIKERMNLVEIQEIYRQREIIIFGAGYFGGLFYKKILKEYTVPYVVDNNIDTNYTFFGKKVVNFEGLLRKYNNEIIVITTMNCWKEVAEQLEKHGFQFKKNYVIWNGVYDEKSRIDFGDGSTKRLIKKNLQLWSGKKKNNRVGKILIPYRESAEIVYGPWSYAANYLSDKYDAEIFCVGGIESAFNKELLELYYSFNVSGVIDETPDAVMVKEIDTIFEQVWQKINSEEDILDIEIYGEKYGKDIIRDYLRREFPIIYISDINLKNQIRKMVGYIVFWNRYINKYYQDIKAIILWDGIYYREGIMRKLAVAYDIPVYTIVNTTAFRWEYEEKCNFEFYKKFYNMLSVEERENGIYWAKERLKEHLCGQTQDMDMVNKSVFESKSTGNILEKNEKTKVMICPHYSEDDAFPYGDMLFSTPWKWLEYLGELSQKTDYDWYLKPHPCENELGDKLISDYLKKYSNIKLLPKYISPIQLKEEGMKYALTIHGSIGYEYPLVGINAINAGYNPHIAFEFSINPKTLNEYETTLYSLNKIKKKINIEEIYMFYSIHFGYYEHRRIKINRLFFKDMRLQEIRGITGCKTERTTELFDYYVDEIDDERHLKLQKITQALFEKMDNYRDGVFYKKNLQ